MAQDLTTSSQASLPAVDLSEPVTILSLPPWLATQVAAVSDLGAGRTILDPESKAILRQDATIPKSKMPTGPQRLAITRRIEELHAASMPGPLPSTLAIIGTIVKRNRAASQDEDLADIEIEAYRDALEDLPAWAVREALRRWRRGEVGGDRRDLNFAPKEHRLREIALRIESSVRGQIIRLQRVLDAKSEEELDAAARAEVIKKGMNKPPKMGEFAEPAGTDAATRASAERDLQRMAAEAAGKAAEAPTQGQSA